MIIAWKMLWHSEPAVNYQRQKHADNITNTITNVNDPHISTRTPIICLHLHLRVWIIFAKKEKYSYPHPSTYSYRFYQHEHSASSSQLNWKIPPLSGHSGTPWLHPLPRAYDLSRNSSALSILFQNVLQSHFSHLVFQETIAATWLCRILAVFPSLCGVDSCSGDRNERGQSYMLKRPINLHSHRAFHESWHFQVITQSFASAHRLPMSQSNDISINPTTPSARLVLIPQRPDHKKRKVVNVSTPGLTFLVYRVQKGCYCIAMIFSIFAQRYKSPIVQPNYIEMLWPAFDSRLARSSAANPS